MDGREGQGRGKKEGRGVKGRVEEGKGGEGKAFQAFPLFQICHYTTAFVY